MIPGLGRSPGEGKGYPLQYSGLENSMDCIVHGITKSWTQLSDFHSLTCLLRNLYAGQEATVKTRQGTMHWFQIEKGVHQGCILSPCFFNLYAENTMRNARLDEVQAGTKVARRNINNLRYADDTTLMAESRGTTSLLMKVKEESGKRWLKTRHSKNEDHGIQSHHFVVNR